MDLGGQKTGFGSSTLESVIHENNKFNGRSTANRKDQGLNLPSCVFGSAALLSDYRKIEMIEVDSNIKLYTSTTME
jgi:hypothetical protein